MNLGIGRKQLNFIGLLRMLSSSTAIIFDLDGTLTSKEILPEIAKEIGIYEEIRVLTEQTIRGQIPFESSFEKRCHMLKEVPISVVSNIVSRVPIFSLIAGFISDNRENCFIATGNLDVWVEPIIRVLDVKCFSSIGKIDPNDSDKIIGVRTILNKVDAVSDVRTKFQHVIAVGDGMGDVGMFEAADVGIAFGGTHEPIEALIQNSKFVTYSEEGLCKLLTQL